MPDEDEEQRLNRELMELLNELRVVLPGVQVLFAFLLTIPFSKGYPHVSRIDRDVYFTALGTAFLSTVLLIAPSAYHRILFRHHDKEYLIERATRLALSGTAVLALSISCALFVVADFVFGAWSACAAAAVTSLSCATFWFVLPLQRRRALDRRRRE